MLITDHSGSMAATDVPPTRLAAAQSAANTFIDQLPCTVRVGAIGFGSTPDAVQGPAANHGAARSLIDAPVGQRRNGYRRRAGARSPAAAGLRSQARRRRRSCCSPTAPPTPVPTRSAVARQAAQDHIPIYTVALGTAGGVIQSPDPYQPSVSVPPDPQLMAQIAQVSGARAFNAQSSDQLSSIYKHLGSQLSTVSRKREITVVVRRRRAGAAARGRGSRRYGPRAACRKT